VKVDDGNPVLFSSIVQEHLPSTLSLGMVSCLCNLIRALRC